MPRGNRGDIGLIDTRRQEGTPIICGHRGQKGSESEAVAAKGKSSDGPGTRPTEFEKLNHALAYDQHASVYEWETFRASAPLDLACVEMTHQISLVDPEGHNLLN